MSTGSPSPPVHEHQTTPFPSPSKPRRESASSESATSNEPAAPGAPIKSKYKQRKERQSASVPSSPSPPQLNPTTATDDGPAPPKHAYAPKRSSSLSLAFTPLRTTLLEEENEDDEQPDPAPAASESTTPSQQEQPAPPSNLASTAKRVQSFEKKLKTPSSSTSGSPAKVRPTPSFAPSASFRRPSFSTPTHSPTSYRSSPARAPSSTPITTAYPAHHTPDPPRPSSNPLAHYDPTGNPEPEDAYYTPSPSRYPSHANFQQPPPHPLLSMALGLHIHQDESHIIEFTDSETSTSGRSDDDEDDDDEDEGAFPRPPEKPSTRRRSSTFIDLPAVPSTVAEEDEKAAEDEAENVCTSCGALPEPSFVALTPCDHLVCHTCMNALINAAAHKPPRPMVCFACARPISSFGPAWESSRGQGAMLSALRTSLQANSSTRVPPRSNPPRATAPAFVPQPPPPQLQPPRPQPYGSGPAPAGYYMHPITGQTIFYAPPPPPAWAPATSAAHGLPPVFAQLFDPYGQHSSYPYQPTFHPPTTQPQFYHPPTTPPRVASLRTPRTSPSTPRGHERESTGGTTGTPELTRDAFSPARRIDWAAETMTPPQNAPVEPVGRTKFDNRTFKSPLELQQLHELKDPVDWPIVRLDNIPWDVTVAQVEEWLPANSLAPADRCVLAVHILCNRADGRTLNQCYIEAASITAARAIVRTRDGKKLLNRPVHITISSSSELMCTLFPSWEPGFRGLDPIPGPTPGPLLLQTEVSGLVSLCKLESPHACKVKERPYMNIVTVLQKFPWHDVECFNSKAVVRLYNGACSAAEILGAVRDLVPDWQYILGILVDAVVACPVFRPSQKSAFLRATGMKHDKYPNAQGLHSTEASVPSGFSFSPTAARDSYVTVSSVGAGPFQDDGSPEFVPFDVARQPSLLTLRPLPPTLAKAVSTPNLAASPPPGHDGSPKQRKRRLSTISKNLGVPVHLVAAIAAQLDVPVRNLA